jgi:hypothetical protein
MTLGYTIWDVNPYCRARAEDVKNRYGGTWNSYIGHGLAPARGQAFTVDHWGPGGRGDPLAESVGDAMVAWILGQNELYAVRILIWYSWIWLPNMGWKPYSGYQGNHGPGPDSHIHVGY